jgi:hypothetical protein
VALLTVALLFIEMQQKSEDKIKELTANKVFANPIVTEVKPVI